MLQSDVGNPNHILLLTNAAIEHRCLVRVQNLDNLLDWNLKVDIHLQLDF